MVVKDDYGKPLAKLCDFGLAKLQSSDQELTRTGTALGSPSYMSPEESTVKSWINEQMYIRSGACSSRG
ncbi:MAG: hypothetical protein R3D26_00370 [Cyanobacteriota/Melainabacteria group bacterium]